MVMSRWVGTPGEGVRLGRVAKRVANCAWLYARILIFRVELEDVVHVFSPIHHNSDVAALARKACASAPGQQGSAVLAADVHGGKDIIPGPWYDHTDGYLTIVGRVRGIHRPASRIEANFTRNSSF